MRRFRITLIAVLAPLAALGAEPPAVAISADLALAREHFAARRDTEAQAAFERVLAADPASHEAVYHLGRLAKRRGDWPAVAEFYERCTQLAPAEALYWADLGEAYGKLAGKASIIKQLGLARKCRAALEKAIELAPDTRLSPRPARVCEKAPSMPAAAATGTRPTTEIAKRVAFAGALRHWRDHHRSKNWAAAEIAYAMRPVAKPPSSRFAPSAALRRAGALRDALVQLRPGLARTPTLRSPLPDRPRTPALSETLLAEGETATAPLPRTTPRAFPAAAQPHAQHRSATSSRAAATRSRPRHERALRLDPHLKARRRALAKLAHEDNTKAGPTDRPLKLSAASSPAATTAAGGHSPSVGHLKTESTSRAGTVSSEWD
jgi:hypothetical protein